MIIPVYGAECITWSMVMHLYASNAQLSSRIQILGCIQCFPMYHRLADLCSENICILVNILMEAAQNEVLKWNTVI